jgi:hypothetical protein
MANQTVTVLEADGVTSTDVEVLGFGRQAAAASKSTAMSTEDKAVLDSLATKLDTAITALQIIDNMVLAAGTNNIGDVDVLTVPADPMGANADAASLTGSISAKLRAIATALGATALDLGVGTGGSRSLRVAIDSSQVQATVAHDAADSGDPLKVGGKAVSAEPTAVTANDRANFITDLVGKHIVLPYANPENFVSGAITSAMTGTTSTSLIAAPAAGLRNYITQITVSNAHATVGTDVVIQDGSGGTTLYTIPAAAVYGGAVITFPTPLRQPTTATAIFCANVTTGASTKVSASGYKGV